MGKYLSKMRQQAMGRPRERAVKAARTAGAKVLRQKSPTVFEEQQAGKCGLVKAM